jgi:two-component system, response regulator
MNPAATIVLAEDDEDDYFFTAQAFHKIGLQERIRRVKDGEELMDLLRRGDAGEPRLPPTLVLLDLRMPKMSGWEALREIKSDALLRRVPVVVLTTSSGEEDIARAYDLGCSSFIRKPMGVDAYAALAQAIKDYWLQHVELPRAAVRL